MPLLGGAGLELKPYPYYDTDRHVIDVDGMLDALRTATAGDAVLLHACCHNPSGLDPTDDDWRAIGPKLNAAVISDEGGRGEHGSFTGAFVGMAAFDVSGKAAEARFTGFSYDPT